MKIFLAFLLIIISVFSCNKSDISIEKKECLETIQKASQQLKYSLSVNKVHVETESAVFPRSLNPDGEMHYVRKRDWTSGFYPGVLWMIYELTGDSLLKKEATLYTNILESEKFNASNHDIGFKMMSSFGLGYHMTKNPEYKDILIQAARTLITRFNENVGCIRSWDHHKDKWDFPVIIDNMMNLELLFFAWHETGEPVFYNIAVKHSETTLENHFREDNSTYHVLSYDTLTGEVMKRNTHQGYKDESCWSRGQAWALYGFTMVYRETQKPEFLYQAEKIADYILNTAYLPDDFVPVWDYNVPENQFEPRDASAAAIMASALYELCEYSEKNRKEYLEAANQMLASLSSEKYFNKQNTHKGFLLNHSTGSKPGGSEIDVPLIYADYYFLEALKRKMNLSN